MKQLPRYQAMELVSLSIITNRMTFRVSSGETCQVSLIAFEKAQNYLLSDGKRYGKLLSVIGKDAYLELPNEILGM